MGAVATLMAKLFLDSKEWSTNLRGASDDLKSFQKKTKNAEDFIGSLGGSLLKTAGSFATWAGAGLAAKEGLEKFMRAGQTTSDWLDQNVNQWKGLFDEFFVALNSGSVTGFVTNMGEVAEAIKQATIAIDAWNDAKASMDVLSTMYTVQQKSLITQIKRNKDNPELVSALQEQLKVLEGQMTKNMAGLVAQTTTKGLAVLNERIYAPGKSSVGGMDKKATTMLFGGLQPSIERMQKLFESEVNGTFDFLVKEAKRYTKIIGNALGKYAGNEAYSEQDKALSKKAVANFERKFGVSILEVLRWSELKDEEGRDLIRQSIKDIYDVQKQQSEFLERNNEALNIKTGTTTITAPKVKGGKASAPFGSLAWYDQQIASVGGQLKNATSVAEAARLQQQLDAYKSRKESLQIAIKLSKGLEAKIEGVGGGIVPIDKNGIIIPSTGNEGNLEETVDTVGDLEKGLSGVAEMLGVVSGMTKEGTQAWLNYASNALGAMRQLMVALQAVGMGQAASQSASAGPWGWLQIPIALASVVAAFASMPKFARGGIVPGTSFSGDRVLAGLNSGEMVLNHSQQARLWNMLANGAVGGAGTVEFEIRGDKLVGVLDNYSRRRAKVV